VPVTTHALDDILIEAGVDRVDVIKVDVEGFERDVFRGAIKVLSAERAPVILFEFCDWAEERLTDGGRGDAQRILRDLGYSIWRLRDAVRSRAPLSGILTAGFETLVAMKADGRPARPVRGACSS
jgi:hypothetical protein